MWAQACWLSCTTTLLRCQTAFALQLDASITRRYGGSGLGLTISQKLSEAMGGRMWAESDGVGHGSTFRCGLVLHAGSLPAHKGTELQMSAGTEPEVAAPFKGRAHQFVVRSVDAWRSLSTAFCRAATSNQSPQSATLTQCSNLLLTGACNSPNHMGPRSSLCCL